MNESILIVEDEVELCMTLGDRLRSEGYFVDFVTDGKAGFEKATTSHFDLIILDIMLPLQSGLDLCVAIRRAGLTTPILLLTARSQTVDKIVGLKLGADDYVTKPFDTLELMTRIEVLLRRNATMPAISSDRESFHFGSIILDVRRTQVTRLGHPVELTAREFQLLRYLAEHPDVTISRDELLSEVWEHRAKLNTRTVDVHIASLRQKLETDPKKPELIKTIPGIGYRLQV